MTLQQKRHARGAPDDGACLNSTKKIQSDTLCIFSWIQHLNIKEKDQTREKLKKFAGRGCLGPPCIFHPSTNKVIVLFH